MDQYQFLSKQRRERGGSLQARRQLLALGFYKPVDGSAWQRRKNVGCDRSGHRGFPGQKKCRMSKKTRSGILMKRWGWPQARAFPELEGRTLGSAKGR